MTHFKIPSRLGKPLNSGQLVCLIFHLVVLALFIFSDNSRAAGMWDGTYYGICTGRAFNAQSCQTSLPCFNTMNVVGDRITVTFGPLWDHVKMQASVSPQGNLSGELEHVSVSGLGSVGPIKYVLTGVIDQAGRLSAHMHSPNCNYDYTFVHQGPPAPVTATRPP